MGRWFHWQFNHSFFSWYPWSSWLLSHLSRAGTVPVIPFSLCWFDLINFFVFVGFWLWYVLQDDSAVTKQKKDAEANWKSQVSFLFSFYFLVKIWGFVVDWKKIVGFCCWFIICVEIREISRFMSTTFSSFRDARDCKESWYSIYRGS
jgi:hypothetical protein